MRVVLAGGGTAGHVEPAIAIAAELEAAGLATRSEIYFVGGFRGLEGKLVPARGFQLQQINIVGLPRKLSLALIKYPFMLWRARSRLVQFLKEIKPDVVIGFGGYVSAPTYLAAKKLGIPIVVHEANARPGVANRRASKFADLVIDSFAGSIPGARTLGVPVRAELVALNREQTKMVARTHFGFAGSNPLLLVFGGSQGAEKINQAVSEIAPTLTSAGVDILHIVGDLNLATYQSLTHQSAGEYKILGYCNRMDLAYAAADLAVTRSGALTVAELAVVGLPAILVPYPVGNGEQEFNAAELVAVGGGKLLLNADCTPAKLKLMITPLIKSPQDLQEMSAKAKSIARPNAAREIVNAVKLVVK